MVVIPSSLVLENETSLVANLLSLVPEVVSLLSFGTPNLLSKLFDASVFSSANSALILIAIARINLLVFSNTFLIVSISFYLSSGLVTTLDYESVTLNKLSLTPNNEDTISSLGLPPFSIALAAIPIASAIFLAASGETVSGSAVSAESVSATVVTSDNSTALVLSALATLAINDLAYSNKALSIWHYCPLNPASQVQFNLSATTVQVPLLLQVSG